MRTSSLSSRPTHHVSTFNNGYISQNAHLLPLVVHGHRQLVVQQRPVAVGSVAWGHLPAGVQCPAALQKEAPV